MKEVRYYMLQAPEIVIEEYEPRRHAKSIAEMWNRSYESWGGDNSYQTEQSVIEEHQNGTHLKLFLAVAGGEVIGYCSFSHYKEDTGALYIPLLNVRPDYHGRKIGKMLILRALEETIKRGWPRLDLYTWPGNTKAVPAYKKSGFFWEKRDDTTHLMNFIPSVLQTGAVKPFFEQLDWYRDSVREISVSPDGRRENGFDYFTYAWEKDGLKLKMEYERTGRGLRLIETDDYLIQASIPLQHQLPFGSSYPVIYEAVNKSGKPLTLQIKGISNPNISFELEETRSVEAAERVEGQFRVHPMEEEQNAYQTHPVVEAELLINGQSAVFKLGIEPKYPVKLRLTLPDRTMLYKGESFELDITAENEYATETLFSFSLPEDAVLAFDQPAVQITVPAKARKTLTVSAQLKEYGIWNPRLAITAHSGSPEAAVIEQEVSLVFPGTEVAIGGKTDKGWLISNGRYSAHLDRSSNTLELYEDRQKALGLMFPKFGLPYTNEFKKSTAEQVTTYPDGEAMVLEARYKLDSTREGLLLTTVIKLHRNGIIERYHQLHNQSGADFTEPLHLKESFGFSLEGAVIPYCSQYIDLNQGVHAASPDYWDVQKLTENWLYADDGKMTRGIVWPADRTLIRDHWLYAVEHPIEHIAADRTVQTGALRIALGTWSNWQDFRSFALQQGHSRSGRPDTSSQLKISLNGGNPFISGASELQLQEQKMSFLEGDISLSSAAGSIVPHSRVIRAAEQLAETSLPLLSGRQGEADMLQLQLDMETYHSTESFLVIPVSGDEVKRQVSRSEQGEVLTADNGVLQIKADSSFAPALFSLQYQGQEWLDSSYPLPQPKSWWNPWTGGIIAGVEGLSRLSLQEEPREAAFAGLTDSKGNGWSGILVSIKVTHNRKLQGLTLNHYFLLLPGVPVLASVVQIVQNTGAPLQPVTLHTLGFYKTGNVLKSSRGTVKNAAGERITYKAGRVQNETISSSGIIQFSSDERKQRMSQVSCPDKATPELLVNTHVISSFITEQLHLRDGDTMFSTPQFYILSDLDIPEEAFRDLLNIKFNL
ncbi:MULTISPECIES: GNAT family N-acetyltransferase [unclassified Paenibacillus]|uniref:GNAT family N-acetyltransferase n=1 Tax=unclassified Paenibacillus TaxID=185978 RepID=UPI0024074626|nr:MULTISPECIES: GNAT family N-acetyltransferase [unclassified Paenibacillus]MDF9839297.1 ribosomal protein S18 acetylase RimI-like enzyme [Paenibacillus sp. PastF-2]MDF9845878.1 ribosomal protein S18 acetylase RimI-like enzyme [Paenibacillus sp. PastM-2]MDF9852451.1 ribosomal protein S18 acetylase RimI-like enzyme [Paenibacillus sp. PastF-1]MDH6477819.1 ribosomal protein S18 acetylase RimI-like enzyme [Paenibacillus sp. PastH-2]MDH6505558.1 ribosomal protein S18 acetylase RimI-like enzyme [Pa